MIQLRPEQPEDYQAIRELLRVCFDREGADEICNEWNLVESIRTTDSYHSNLSLVAIVDERIVGYVMFSDAWIGERKTAALAPLAVLPDYQKQGIGGFLVDSGLEFVRRQGYLSALVLGGDYYQRFGFRPVSDRVTLKPGLDEHLYLYPFLEVIEQEGQVRYSSPFYDQEGNLL